MNIFKSTLSNIIQRYRGFKSSTYAVPSQPTRNLPTIEFYPFVYMHNEGCKEEAFYLKNKPEFGVPTVATDHCYPNGTVPAPGATILCATCMWPIQMHSANVVKRLQ